jgi:two-component system response regulator FixJ
MSDYNLPESTEAVHRTVVVVDDDPAVRDSTATLLKHAGHKVHAFESGDALVEAGVPPDADIILLDIMMPGQNGLEILRALGAAGDLPPVVVVTGHGDIPLAVEAMKLGAVEFLEKPYAMKGLLELVSTLKWERSAKDVDDPRREEAVTKIEALSPRQREILKGIAFGEQSKVTAHRLGLSVRTVEAYRGHLFDRLGVKGIAEAVRIAVLAGLLDT